MLWVKALHIIFMVTWFSGLFYLPRIFVYHAMSKSADEQVTFKTMERKLMIMTHIGGSLTLVFGFWLLLVALLVGYHVWCYRLMLDFRHDRNQRSHRWYRLFNEVPVLFLAGVVLLAVLRPV